MEAIESRELLERYHRKGDEAAFAALVRGHLGLVHAAVVRMTSNPSAAADVSQRVFIKLAQRPAAALRMVSLAVWLHGEARSQCRSLLRAQARQVQRERTAAELADMKTSSIPWEQISPLLDEVIGKLPEKERKIVLARFFQSQSHGEIAGELGVKEDASRMRLRRALERMRGLLAKKGIATTTAALATALPGYAAGTVPAGLAAKVTGAALGAGVTAGNFLTIGIMTMSKKAAVTAGLIALLLVLGGGGVGVLVKERAAAGGLEEKAGSDSPTAVGDLAAGPRATKLGERPPADDRRERMTGYGYGVFREDGRINFELMDLAGISRERADELNEMLETYREQEKDRMQKRWVVVEEDRETETRTVVAPADAAAARRAMEGLKGELGKSFGRAAAEILLPYLEGVEVVAGSGQYEIRVALKRRWAGEGMPAEPPVVMVEMEIRDAVTGKVVKSSQGSADSTQRKMDIALEGQEPPLK